MVAVVTLFTGMIAPVLANLDRSYAFPLTDIQGWAYLVLALLVICFYLVSIQRWRIFQIMSVLLMMLLAYLFFMSVTHQVSTVTGEYIESLSWGWIFLWVGSIFLVYAMFPWLYPDTEEKITVFIDHVLGIIGSFTLLCLTWLVIYVSYFAVNSSKNTTILASYFASWELTSLSWITLSPHYESIHNLVFERKNDTLRFITSSGEKMILFPTMKDYERIPYRIVSLDQKTGIIEASGSIQIDGVTQSGRAIIPQNLDHAIIAKDSEGIILYDQLWEKKVFPGTFDQSSLFQKAENTNTLVWSERTGSGYKVMKNGEQIGTEIQSVHVINISHNGHDTMALVTSLSGQKEIIKNGVRADIPVHQLIQETYISNWSHSLYATETDSIKRMVYDGAVLKNQFEEIREVFLERNGSSYAFFARPLGEKKYCLFTRYRGNICGLDGYMNPRLGADGGSVLYAWLKNGIWSIYRNTDTIVADTKYHGTDIQNDYVFFDITNPKQYLFIEKQTDGKYLYRKNGKIIPGAWDDVGLDVWFGYDNKIITSAKDAAGWRVIEM